MRSSGQVTENVDDAQQITRMTLLCYRKESESCLLDPKGGNLMAVASHSQRVLMSLV